MTVSGEAPPVQLHPRGTTRAREERRLLLSYHRDGDQRVRDDLLRRYLPLARRLARRYHHGREPLEDLVQVASLGLVKAFDRYDPDRGTAFSSFAVPTMLGELKRHFRDVGWALHVPRGLQERALLVKGALDDLFDELGRPPTTADIAGALGIPPEEVLEALEAGVAHEAQSLESPRRGDDDGERGSLVDSIGDEDKGFELVELSATIEPGIRELADRDREILRMRFVEDMTQSQIAERLDVSQMHISRLLRRALDRLRTGADAAVA